MAAPVKHMLGKDGHGLAPTTTGPTHHSAAPAVCGKCGGDCKCGPSCGCTPGKCECTKAEAAPSAHAVCSKCGGDCKCGPSCGCTPGKCECTEAEAAPSAHATHGDPLMPKELGGGLSTRKEEADAAPAPSAEAHHGDAKAK